MATSNNREKARQYNREWCRRNKARFKVYKLKSRFGLTPLQLEAIAEEQDFKCAICKLEAKLCVDHDHKTGVIRGLLCGTCNTALGMFKDNINNLQAAINYLIDRQKGILP